MCVCVCVCVCVFVSINACIDWLIVCVCFQCRCLPWYLHPCMCVCVCVCYLTGFSPDSSAPCPAVTAHSAVVAGATGIRKNNMKQFKKPCRREKGEWERLSHFLQRLSCKLEAFLSACRGRQRRGRRSDTAPSKSSSRTNPHNRSETSDRSQSLVLFSSRQILNYLKNLTIFNLQPLYQLIKKKM